MPTHSPNSISVADELWSLRPSVKVISLEKSGVLLTRLGQRLLFKTPESLREISLAALQLLQTPQSQLTLSKLIPDCDLELASSLIEALNSKSLLLKSTSKQGHSRESSWRSFSSNFSNSLPEIDTALERVHATRVRLASRFHLPEDFLSEWKVETTNIEFAFDESSDRLLILIVSSNDHSILEKLSAKAYQSGCKILPVLVDAYGAMIGPFSGNDGQPCLSCLSRRLRSNTSVSNTGEATLHDSALFNSAVEHWPQSFFESLSAVLSTELFKITSELVYSRVMRGTWIFDFLNHRRDYEDVFPIPGCECAEGLRERDFEIQMIPV